jgi:hypothetical protein
MIGVVAECSCGLEFHSNVIGLGRSRRQVIATYDAHVREEERLLAESLRERALEEERRAEEERLRVAESLLPCEPFIGDSKMSLSVEYLPSRTIYAKESRTLALANEAARRIVEETIGTQPTAECIRVFETHFSERRNNESRSLGVFVNDVVGIRRSQLASLSASIGTLIHEYVHLSLSLSGYTGHGVKFWNRYGQCAQVAAEKGLQLSFDYEEEADNGV